MIPDLVVTGSRVVTAGGERAAAIVVTHGVIDAVVAVADAPAARERIDAGDAAVLPGVVDSHVHVNEPGRTAWEGFDTATRAAAAGGVTTIVDMPLNCIPATTTVAALRAKAGAASGVARVDYGFWGGVVPGNEAQLDGLVDAGVLGFKCFLVPSGVDEFPAVARRDLEAAMPRLARRDAVLLVHAELPGSIVADPPGDPRHYATWLASRPPQAELDAIDLVLDLARRTTCRVHIVHLASPEAAARIAAARRRGVRVTTETCPHYLTFAAEEIPDGATAFKCAPPIRDRARRDRLWEEVERGTIDLVASDHSPAPPALKRLDTGDFLGAWGGIASLELSLAAVWTGARRRGATPGHLARWMAEGPARLAGLPRKGRIAPGYDADLVCFDATARRRVDATRLHQRHPVTPYAGLALDGVVRRTLLRGRTVYADGEFPGPPAGQWCRRSP